ncbi:MAG: winged helix-turn-helix domain-containing protein [Candidatus Acidiferrales bacterium]
MSRAKPEGRIFRFGVFELDESSGELRKQGKPLPRLRDQALKIIVTLIERPQALVTRDELRDRLWSSDTFVDFDHGLNTAINQLRTSLGDSATNPRFIQTLPRRGYRFIAPVEIRVGPNLVSRAAENISKNAERALLPMDERDQPDYGPSKESLLSDARDLPIVSESVVRALFSLIQLMYLNFYIISLAHLRQAEAIQFAFLKPTFLILTILIVTAAAGIPIRLYLLTAAAFKYRGLNRKFQKLFPIVFVLDELWALAPFLIVEKIGIGLALGATAALLYVPFSQRSLLLMGFANNRKAG